MSDSSLGSKDVSGDWLDSLGRLVSLNVLVASALSLVARDNEDPRGALADVLSTVEEELGDTIANIGVLDVAQRAAVSHAARSNVLTVGKIADSFLAGMGVPPALRREF